MLKKSTQHATYPALTSTLLGLRGGFVLRVVAMTSPDGVLKRSNSSPILRFDASGTGEVAGITYTYTHVHTYLSEN
jgi:hypothetical protein